MVKEIGTHQGMMVIECDQHMSEEQLANVKGHLEQAFPDGCVVLTKGLRVSNHEQLGRIEAKLDALLEALAEEEEPETVEIVTMDGERATLPATPAGVL